MTAPPGLRELLTRGRVVLIDCEFTCWPDSLATGWADPARPAELIEIGLAEYDVARQRVGRTFTSLVRPRLNPALSDYCRQLLGIPQEAIDAAPPLPTVLAGVEAWLDDRGLLDAAVCEWAIGDLPVIEADARRHGLVSPFAGHAVHLPLRDVYRRLLDGAADADDRDGVRRRFGLPSNPARHRALADALDLATFLAHLREVAAAGKLA